MSLSFYGQNYWGKYEFGSYFKSHLQLVVDFLSSTNIKSGIWLSYNNVALGVKA